MKRTHTKRQTYRHKSLIKPKKINYKRKMGAAPLHTFTHTHLYSKQTFFISPRNTLSTFTFHYCWAKRKHVLSLTDVKIFFYFPSTCNTIFGGSFCSFLSFQQKIIVLKHFAYTSLSSVFLSKTLLVVALKRHIIFFIL